MRKEMVCINAGLLFMQLMFLAIKFFVNNILYCHIAAVIITLIKLILRCEKKLQACEKLITSS